jgi:hypothetical protein
MALPALPGGHQFHHASSVKTLSMTCICVLNSSSVNGLNNTSSA